MNSVSFNYVGLIIFVLQMTFMETIGSMLAHSVVMTHFTQRHYCNYFLTTTSINTIKNDIDKQERNMLAEN
jgi:hypothetical protein